MTAANYQGGCPYSSVSLHGAQNNQFLRGNGPVQRLFEGEYIRFVKAMLEMPE